MELTEYAGAYHIFDDPSLDAIVRFPNAITRRHCALEEERPGRIVNAQSREPFTWDDPCLERGATVGYQLQAHSEAVKAVKQFLTVRFQLQ